MFMNVVYPNDTSTQMQRNNTASPPINDQITDNSNFGLYQGGNVAITKL